MTIGKSSLETATVNRRSTISNIGYMGLVPRRAQAGDLICVLFGTTTPYLLRPVESGAGMQYQLVGHCYVHGLMDGEAKAMLAKGQVERRDFVLV